MKKLTEARVSTACLILLLIAFLSWVVLNLNADEKKEAEPYQEFRELFGEEVYGYSVGFTNPKHEPLGEKLIWNMEDNVLDLEFTNARTDGEFLLKILWNFEEIDFSIDGGAMNNHYVFSSSYKETKRWQVSFAENLSDSSEEFLGHIAAIVLSEPNVYQKNANFYDHNYYGFVGIQYVFTRGKLDDFDEFHEFDSRKIIPENAFQEFDKYNGGYNSINVTDDAQTLINNPSPYLVVNPGEIVELNFLIGASILDLDEYVLVGLLGNDQVELNGHPNIPIRLSKDPETNEILPQAGKLSFVAPDEPGDYEFLVYQFGLGNKMLGLSMVDNSFRITIVVK